MLFLFEELKPRTCTSYCSPGGNLGENYKYDEDPTSLFIKPIATFETLYLLNASLPSRRSILVIVDCIYTPLSHWLTQEQRQIWCFLGKLARSSILRSLSLGNPLMPRAVQLWKKSDGFIKL